LQKWFLPKVAYNSGNTNVRCNNKTAQMGLFNFFKKQDKQDQTPQGTLMLQGPKYLRKNLAIPTPDLIDIVKIKYPDIQWIGQLITSTQNRHFKIQYYGDLMNNETIIGSDKGVQRLIAIDSSTDEEILLFDKTVHGWEGFITDAYEEQKSIPRLVDKIYRTKKNADTFRILFLAFYNYGTKQELLELKNAEGQVELGNGSVLNIQDAFDDAFDAVVIYAIDDNGNRFELINEELA